MITLTGPLTVQTVRALVECIRAADGDAVELDDLFHLVLQAIAEGHPEPVRLARAAIRS